MINDEHFQIQVVDQLAIETGSTDGNVTTGCLVFIYDTGTKTLSTIYADSNRAAKTNPITRAQFATDTKIDFWVPLGNSFDIFLAHSDGSTAVYAGVTATRHTLRLNRDGVFKCLVAAFASNTAETDTGLDFPLNTLVMPPIVEVTAAHAAKTIDVGLLSSETAGDADGLIVAASLAATGFVKPYTTVVGGTETYINSAITGVLIGKGSVGTDAANDFGQPGGIGHIVSGANARSLVYTCSAATTTAAGYIYAPFRHLR